MAKRTYIITVDPSDPAVDLPALKERLRSDPAFSGWWNHIPYVFLVTSEQDADSIADLLRPYTGEARLLVMQVDPADSDGWLPTRSWDWIKKREPSATKSPTN